MISQQMFDLANTLVALLGFCLGMISMWAYHEIRRR